MSWLDVPRSAPPDGCAADDAALPWPFQDRCQASQKSSPDPGDSPTSALGGELPVLDLVKVVDGRSDLPVAAARHAGHDQLLPVRPPWPLHLRNQLGRVS